MGVPALFRWLNKKYPKIVSDAIVKNSIIDDNNIGSVEMEFDNLYLDMNGIIHPCTHPENKPPPKNEEEMFYNIFLYIDAIINICRPRKLIYMAVDGVAPRAKMNEQRSRRFRSSKESREKRITLSNLRRKLISKGIKLPDLKNAFDSNCITPGTSFMIRLSIALQYFIYVRLNNDTMWQNLEIILSDAKVPGEGEHKIMDFIRHQRESEAYDPNTKHCLCGADADLIMLGLATHEPYFTIIREKFKFNELILCNICEQIGHSIYECKGLKSQEFNNGVNIGRCETEFIFIHLNILREYLKKDLVMTGLPFKYDFERIIDDWVFMCFFVGNDFLPHLPSLSIRGKAIDRLVNLYKQNICKSDGYLTENGSVNLKRLQMIMREIAAIEDDIFKNQHEDELRYINSKKNIKKVFLNKTLIEDIYSDDVKLWEEGYRKRYYEKKFNVNIDLDSYFGINVANEYVKGLCWVLSYYYQGCKSWDWYFPYRYAPFAVDFCNIESVDIEFPSNTEPFRPLEQLMAVLTADSKCYVPQAWQNLMTDPNSPIIDFYPSDFKIDLNGKKFEWQGVALLPFVDEKRLLKVLKEKEDLLTDDERKRNEPCCDLYFVRATHMRAKLIKNFTKNAKLNRKNKMTNLDPCETKGISGRIFEYSNALKIGSFVESPIGSFADNINDLQVVAAKYKNPYFVKGYNFKATLLPKVKMPNSRIGLNAIEPGLLQNRSNYNTSRRPMHSIENNRSHSNHNSTGQKWDNNLSNRNKSNRAYITKLNQ